MNAWAALAEAGVGFVLLLTGGVLGLMHKRLDDQGRATAAARAQTGEDEDTSGSGLGCIVFVLTVAGMVALFQGLHAFNQAI